MVLTHHHLKDLGGRSLGLAGGDTPKLAPITEAGSGSVQEQQKVYMAELIAKLNDMFGGDTSDQDKLRFASYTFEKVLESDKLRQQAHNNTNMQFIDSPDVTPATLNAVIEGYDAHSSLSKQALNSPAALRCLVDVFHNHFKLYDRLREPRAP